LFQRIPVANRGEIAGGTNMPPLEEAAG